MVVNQGEGLMGKVFEMALASTVSLMPGAK
jgi:hypothetical protein